MSTMPRSIELPDTGPEPLTRIGYSLGWYAVLTVPFPNEDAARTWAAEVERRLSEARG